MQTHQLVNNPEGTFGSITVKIESVPERASKMPHLHTAASSSGGLRSARQPAAHHTGTSGTRSTEPTPGSSSQTRTCGSTTRDIQITGPSTSYASPSCASLTDNTLPGCSSRTEFSNVSHLKAHFYSNECRVCLEQGTIPIYGSASGIGEAISLIASVVIGNEKQFPRHLCVKCYSLLQGAMKFRKLAQQTDKILKQSNCVSNTNHLEEDNENNVTHDPGTILKLEASVDSCKAEHTESKLAYDFKKAYQMLISQSTPSGKCSDGDNNDAGYKKIESSVSSGSKPMKLFKQSNSDTHCKKSLEDDDDFFDSEVSSSRNPYKKCDAFRESIHLFLKTEIVEESQVTTDQQANEQGMMMNLIRCDICNKVFAHVHQKKHLAAHGMIQCKVCKSPCLKTNYRKHMREQHNKVLKYTCNICGCKMQSTLRQYKRHMAKHRVDSPYKCDGCSKSFKLQSLWAKHRLTHDYSLPFQCDLCPYRGRAKESLKMHMMSHTGEKPYHCPECPFRSVNTSNLRRHMHTHNKQRNFHCDTCGKAYFMKRDLVLHIKVGHTGAKDHVCNICDKAFGYRSKLLQHQLKVHKRKKLRSGRMPVYLQIESQKQLGQIK